MRGKQIPLLLECGHSICYGCAKLYPEVSCSLCGELVQAKENKSELYPLNIYALGLVVVANHQPCLYLEEPDISFTQTVVQKTRPFQISGYCHECEIEATLRCPQCNVLYCQTCYSKIHGKALQNHSKILINEITKDIPLTILSVCSDTCIEYVGYFCNDCQISSCSHCMLRYHSKHNHISLLERNEELMDDFTKAYDDVAESLQRVLQTLKKLKTIEISQTEIKNNENVEASITQHFAHLHGVLQNIERRMIDKIHGQNTSCITNIKELESQLKSYQNRLQGALLVASTAKENIKRIDLKNVICKLKDIADVPCHLVKESLINEEKVKFEADKSIIDVLEKHCTLQIPSKMQFNLLRTELLPENYQVEPLDNKIAISNRPLMEELSVLPNKTVSVTSLSSGNTESSLRFDSYELVKVLKVVDPSCFYVQSISVQKQAEKLSNDLQVYGSEAVNPTNEIIVGTMYIVKYYTRREKRWQRGKVIKINVNQIGDKTYDVFYVDNGYIERNISVKRLKLIPSQLAAVPILATKCSLYNISPTNDRWSKNATDTFRQLVNKYDPISMYVVHTVGNINYVDLCFKSNNPQEEISSVRDLMIFMEHGTLTSSQKIKILNPLSMYLYFHEELEMETYVYVTVQHVESPNSMYVTKIGENRKHINELMKDMASFYKKNAGRTSLSCPLEINTPCALRLKGSWYRGLIKKIVSEKSIDVFCVDYGYTLTSEHNMLKLLPHYYMSSRTQAIQISLKDLKPLLEDNNQWSLQTIEITKQYLVNEKVKVISMFKNEDIYEVYLYINNINFNSMLANKGFARPIGPTALICYDNKEFRSIQNRNNKNENTLSVDVKENNEETSNTQAIEPDPFKVSVQVHKAISPDCIYVSDVSREEAKFIFMSKLQDFYSKYHSPQEKNWTKDSVCAVYSKQDKSYFRAYILNVISSEEVLVSFYDMAIEEIISVKHIQPLHPIFRQEPAYIFKVKLAGILPCGGSKLWPSISCQKLSEIIEENQNSQFYITKVLGMEDSKEISVQLWIKQSKPDGPLSPMKTEINSVNKMLVEAGLALPIKDFNTKIGKILAIELKRQLLEIQITCQDKEENIKWFSVKEGLECCIESNQLNNNEISMSEIMSKHLSINSENEEEIENVKNKEVRYKVKNEVKDEVEGEIEDELEDEIEDEEDEEEGNEEEEEDEDEDEDEDEESTSSTNDAIQVPILTDWLPALPIKKKNFIAIPTYLDHSGMVYLHSKKDAKKTLEYIETMLADSYKKFKIKPRDRKWKEGDMCIAQYHANKKWYRAKVLAVLDENTIEVQFVDYGNIEECTVGLIKKKIILDHIPIQCTKCVVLGLNPEQGKWKIEDLDRIHVLLVEKECKVSVLEKTDTHLVVSITLLKPKQCDLLSFITNELGIRLSSDSIYSNPSKISDNITSSNISSSSSDINIEYKYRCNIENRTISEIETDSEMTTEYVSNIVSNMNSESSMLIKNVDELHNPNDDLQTIKKELVHYTSKITSTECFATYIPIIIPNDIDIFEVDLCYTESATIYYTQIRENKKSKVLNDCYNRYKLLMESLQKEAPKQPLIKSLVSNTPCCALFNDDIWYRCIIKKTTKIKNSNKILVHLWYVDFGNDEYRKVTLEECNLRILKEEWFNVPTIAIKCQLWNINVAPSKEFSNVIMEIEKMYRKYNDCIIVKIKERCKNHLSVELYVDRTCKKLVYSSLIRDGFFQINKTKKD
ncbi:RING finger protein 17 isoform X3 [Vespula pensylvanica]|nr:RING finger protein 17 isoform X3 [Vespula pensylvanica]XP_043682631.1 RING finger protein 17 isoform X3 [Vespula pensylvanica]